MKRLSISKEWKKEKKEIISRIKITYNKKKNKWYVKSGFKDYELFIVIFEGKYFVYSYNPVAFCETLKEAKEKINRAVIDWHFLVISFNQNKLLNEILNNK